jgi:hypothetical protein
MWQKIVTFFNANKVFILGLLGAIGVTLDQYVNQTTPDYKVIGFAVVSAILSYFAKNLRGQWASIAGLLGMEFTTYMTAVESGNKVSWFQLVGSFVVSIIAVVAPPAKPLSYEKSDVIQTAKQEADQINKSEVPPITTPTAKPD